MTKLTIVVPVLAVLIGLSDLGRAADDKEADAILAKAIKALGGEEKLSKVKAISWTTKGTVAFMGTEGQVTTRSTAQGLDHARQEFEGDFDGNQVKGVTVLAGKQGWRYFGDMDMPMDEDAVANEKRSLYLQVIPVTLVALKAKDFKVEVAPDQKVADKPAAALKITGPDKKEFTMYFDQQTGLPVKQVARVVDFQGGEFTQETLYAEYKDFEAIKKATKITITRDGEKFIDQKITEFKVLDKVDPKTFAQPQ